MAAVKVPPGLTAAITAGTPANSSVCANALDSSMTLVAQAEPAGAGPTDPDMTTVSPAVIALGLTWRVVAGAAHAGAAGASMPTVAANNRAANPQPNTLGVKIRGSSGFHARARKRLAVGRRRSWGMPKRRPGGSRWAVSCCVLIPIPLAVDGPSPPP